MGGIFPGVGSKVGRSVFTEDISLEGVFLQRAIAERAVVFTRVVTEWYMVLLFKRALFFLEGVS